MAPDRRPSRGQLLLVGAITLVGLLLRLRSLSDSLFGDELSTYYTVAGHGLGRTLRIVESDQELTPPLYYVLAWLAARLGDTPEALRLPSLLAGIAAIPLTYLLGLRTVGRRAAIVGAALVATSPFLIFYSTEARAYSLMLLLGLVSTLTLLRALDHGRPRWWAAYAVSSCAALYTHYTVVFVLAGAFAWACFTRPGARRPLLAANAAAALGFLPWLPQFLADSRSPCARLIAMLQPFGLHTVRIDVGRWGLGHPDVSLATVPGHAALALLLVGIAAGVIGLLLERPGRPSRGVVLVLVLALAAPVGAALYSTIGNSVYISRNLIASWPGLALATGALVTGPSPIRRYVSPTLVLAAFAVAGAQMLRADTQRVDYGAAARFIDAAAAGTPVVEVPFPAPGPLSGIDVALSGLGRPSLARHPLLLLGAPSIAAAERARSQGVSACAVLPIPAPRTIAAQAVRLAAGRPLFLATLGAAPISQLRAAAGNPVATFLAALPPGYRVVWTRTFPGLAPLSVYELARAKPPTSVTPRGREARAPRQADS